MKWQTNALAETQYLAIQPLAEANIAFQKLQEQPQEQSQKQPQEQPQEQLQEQPQAAAEVQHGEPLQAPNHGPQQEAQLANSR